MNDYQKLLSDEAQRLGITVEEATKLAAACLAMSSDAQLRLYNKSFKIIDKEHLVRRDIRRNTSEIDE
ncbi:hypothetical protein ABGV42_01130 [Paenibacillus pabuli]|uniref:hypothetical protein n=1 Tax=Paenibacillus pabuli TaxID=1472 RepID=UPI0032426376